MSQKLLDKFGGYPIKEAKSDLVIYLQDVHIEDATVADPSNCAFAMACKDTLKSPFAWFWRAWAYVVLPDDKGVPSAFRFQIPQRTSQQIIDFDRTGHAAQGGYWLKAPPEGSTLEARRKRDRQYAKDIKDGKRQAPKGRRKKGKLAPPKELHGVRSGTGQVRFSPIKESV